MSPPEFTRATRSARGRFPSHRDGILSVSSIIKICTLSKPGMYLYAAAAYSMGDIDPTYAG